MSGKGDNRWCRRFETGKPRPGYRRWWQFWRPRCDCAVGTCANNRLPQPVIQTEE